MAGSCGRKNLGEPVRGAAHAPLIELAKVADDEDVRLHHRIDLRVCFSGFWQPDVKGSHIGPPRLAFESQPDLKMQLPYDFLMRSRRRRRLSDVGDPIDQLIPLAVRPSQVVSVRMM
jgi:hypothetical protein